MVGIRPVGVGERQWEDSFVCIGEKAHKRVCTWDFLWDQKKTRKGKVPEQSTDREKRRSERSDCWGEELGLVDPEARPVNARGWVSVPGFLRVHAQDSLRMPEKCQNFSLFTLRANPSPCLFVLLSSTLSCIYYICCIFVKHVKCPWPEMRETTRWFGSHELILKVEIVGTGRVGYIVTQPRKW